jgi:hypothetical protein
MDALSTDIIDGKSSRARFRLIEILDLDEEAFGLGTSLNIDRRQLST